MSTIKGTLIPIGGNEEKGSNLSESERIDFVTEGILSRVVRESGGTDAHIIVIPTASSIPTEVGENYRAAFTKLGCTRMEVLDIRDRSQAESEEHLRKIRNCNCVMFSGGDQSKISDKIGGTSMHKILNDRYINEDFVIAGTSAGAMAMSAEMISGGSSTESLIKDSVRMREGLGLIPGLIIDSHFITRGRFGRLAEAVAKFPSLVGVGLAEDTGLLIKGGEKFTVIGSGMVIVFDPSNLTHNNVELLEPGTPMTMTNLTTHVLANSDTFNVKSKAIHVLPIEADFE